MGAEDSGRATRARIAESVSGVPATSRVVFVASGGRHTSLQGDWSSDVCSSDLFQPCDSKRPPLAPIPDGHPDACHLPAERKREIWHERVAAELGVTA